MDSNASNANSILSQDISVSDGNVKIPVKITFDPNLNSRSAMPAEQLRPSQSQSVHDEEQEEQKASADNSLIGPQFK